jgi:hypothetical protein
MLTKAKAELLNGGFIFQTVQGCRPNRASWYALTWRVLDPKLGYDVGAAECFERGAYRKNRPEKIEVLIPPHGTGKGQIVPPHGTETLPTVPPHGAIRAIFTPLSVPPHGNPLETPSHDGLIEAITESVWAKLKAQPIERTKKLPRAESLRTQT